MNKINSKLIPITFILSILLLFYYFVFFGVTYKFKSKIDVKPRQTNEIMTFNKTFNEDEIENINILADSSYILIEKNYKNSIEISSKYNSQSLFYVKLKNKNLTIKQYANSAQEKDTTKYLSIKLPTKDFNKLKVSSPILNIKLDKCYFKYIDIKSNISTIDLTLQKSPKKTQLNTNAGNIKLNIPNSNNEFKILTSRSEVSFFGEKYLGFINKKFGNGSSFFSIYCRFGSVFIF